MSTPCDDTNADVKRALKAAGDDAPTIATSTLTELDDGTGWRCGALLVTVTDAYPGWKPGAFFRLTATLDGFSPPDLYTRTVSADVYKPDAERTARTFIADVKALYKLKSPAKVTT